MLDFDQAQAQLLAFAQAPDTIEYCALSQARGRVLAETLHARLDLPPADNSAMDGYAVRHADLAAGQALPVAQIQYAGQAPAALPAAHAARIFTGGLVPDGADTVVIQENCVAQDGQVSVLKTPALGSNIRRRGEDIQAGQQLLTAGTVLGPAHLGLLAAQGCAVVAVRPRFKVAVLNTGDELVPPGQPLPPGAIHESNGALLSGLLEQLGCEVVRVCHAPDDLAQLKTTLQDLAGVAQLIVTTGGVSVGDRDLVKPALQELGGDLALWKVQMKPGKPVALGQVDGVPVLGLPGNPVSAWVVLTVLGSPMIRAWQGRVETLPPVLPARLRTPRPYSNKREEFLRVQATLTPQGLEVSPHPQQGSGILHGLAWADGLARIPAGQERGDGDSVAYYAFDTWLR